MKSIRILTLTICFAALAVPATTFAGKGEKKGKGGGKAAAQYDTNADGKIDGTEAEAMQKAFTAEPTGPLKELDTDSDGKLSDGEISAIKIHAKGDKKKKKAA